MAHPRGHDLMGQAEKSLMLMVGVFIRPAAIVIGFVFLSGWEWYASLPIGIVVAAVVVIFGGFIKGKLNQ